MTVTDDMTGIWAALSDPTRRQILDLLREQPRTTGKLADQFPTSRFAIMKHLTALESAGLIVVRRRGRERWNHLNAVPLQMLYERWVRPYEAIWASRLTKLRSNIEGGTTMDQKGAGLEQVELEVGINASRERVWQAIVGETTLWWPRDFYTNPSTQGFHIEPKLGGKVYEDQGNGNGVIWYEVFAIEPPHKLDLKGYMSVPWGPSLSLLHIELDDRGSATALKLSDSIIGRVSPDDRQSKIDGWKQLFEDGLKTYVEALN